MLEVYEQAIETLANDWQATRQPGKNRVLLRASQQSLGGSFMSTSVENSTQGSATPNCDVVIRGGRVFDGAGSPGVSADVAIDGGKVQAVGPRLPQQGRREVDAAGCWVMPGMLDIHTHYDAEIEAMPGLEESVRHGVTTVVMGNCSLSAALGTKKDLLDLFCRVESLPRDVLVEMAGRRAHLERRARVLRPPGTACRWARTWPA